MTNKNTDDEQLLTDIEYAKLELDAYTYISDGFLILSNIPDIDPFQSRAYFSWHTKYLEFKKCREELLNDLLKIKNDRGL